MAGSDSSHSVRLTALSDVIFSFGFSLHEPLAIAETLYNPLLGIYLSEFQSETPFNGNASFRTYWLTGKNNIFSIAASDPTLINNLTAIRITLHHDNDDRAGNPPEKAISFKLDLHPIRRKPTSDDDGGGSKAESLFATKPFEPPRRAFKIEVKIILYGAFQTIVLSNINNLNFVIYNHHPCNVIRLYFHSQIIGFDKYGNPLQRLLSTIVQSTDESMYIWNHVTII